MNKRTVRAFSLGILLAVILLGFGRNGQSTLNLTDAKEKVEDEGFIVITKEEYDKLAGQSVNEEDSQPPAEGQADKETETDTEKEEETAPQEEQPAKDESSIIHFTLEIESGMNSEQIAVILEQKKVIDDSDSFEQYLLDHDYNTKVQIGSFDLTSEMSYEEISKIITKS
jgi:homospermidine synthase